MPSNCRCDWSDRRWNPNTRKCETCKCYYTTCGASASPQGYSCIKAVGHRGEHMNEFGEIIHAKKDNRGP